MPSVKLVAVTPDAEAHIVRCARVSNPKSQAAGGGAGRLIHYCIRNKHWSIFEHGFLTVEIEGVSRAIATQILRHRSFTFQEYSQRYATIDAILAPHGGRIPTPALRRQDKKNRQNSIDDLPEATVSTLQTKIDEHFARGVALYNELIAADVAKECARMVLPLASPTRLVMSGNIRSFIHYIELRSGNGTQSEHTAVANAIREIFVAAFPLCAKALGWAEPEDGGAAAP